MSLLLNVAGLPRSTYYYYTQKQKEPEKYVELKEEICSIAAENKGRYGYRRVTQELRNRGFHYNHKLVMKLMKQLGLSSKVRVKKYRSYKGEVGKIAPNLLERNFYAEKPNQKWVTDISYIQTQEGVLYLSMIRDLYDRSIVAYRTGTSQTINLVLDTIHLAMKSVKTESRRELHLHSDQGFQYTSQAYFDLTKEYGILPSMSRRGNCYDNALAENFFGILKTECIYRHKPETFEEANKMIDDYIYFYNHERIQLKTGLSPLSLRPSG